MQCNMKNLETEIKKEENFFLMVSSLNMLYTVIKGLSF